MTSSPGAVSRPISVFPILTVNFVGALGFSIVMPSLVFLVTRFGGNAFVYGLIGATYSLFQLIGAPILGRLSDRYGRRRILLLSEIGTFASWGIFLIALALPDVRLVSVDSPLVGALAITAPLAVLFFARALDGITGGDVSIANAYLADISDERDRSANFGRMAVASNLGFVFGPALAGLLGTLALGEVLPVIAAMLISGLACLIIAFGLPETVPCVLAADPERVNVRKVFGLEQKECFTMQAAPKLRAREILALPSMKLLLAQYFLVFFAFNLFYVVFPVYATTGIGWSLLEIGVYFAAMGLIMALVQGPVLTWLSARWSERRRVLGGGIVLAASFLFFISESTAMIYVGTALLAAGNGVMWPSLLAILSRAADRSVQGAVQGFAGSAAATASIAGLLLGGALYNALGSGVFLISAALIGACCGLALLAASGRS